MADLIDRQAALEELAVYIHLIDKTMGKGLLTDDDCMEAAKSVLGEDELPAVQPDHNADIGKKVCVDTISRQAAIEAVGDWIYNPEDLRYHKDVINSIPAVQPTCKPMYADVSDTISRQWLMECVSEGWIKFDTEKDENKFMHLVRDIAPSAQPATNCSEIPNGSDDTISRRAAIDALTHEWDGMVTSVFDVIKSLPSAQPEQRWVPCSERLPEKNCRCLTTNEAWGSFEVDWNAWIDGQWLYPNEKPIAWMPLPEPYRGGEQDDR